MAKKPVPKPAASCRTICLPITEERYQQIVNDAQPFRQWLEEAFQRAPELFPEVFSQGCSMKDQRTSTKMNVVLRRIKLRDGSSWTIRPSFVTPGMTARTKDVQDPMFLRKFGVPYWALAHVFGRDPMFYYRLEVALGRNSVVGTTVRRADLPKQLLADEHHQTREGEKTYIATVVAEGCWLGAEISDTANAEDLTKAYGVFREEALNVNPKYAPQSVNTDGWKATQAAWKTLFPAICVIRCFLHAWLKIRERGKHLKEDFFEVSRRVWEAYRAPNRRSFSQRIRSLRSWASAHLSGLPLEKTLDLCDKRDIWSIAYSYSEAHRTSNMLDRLMRGMNRGLTDGQHLHGSRQASQLRSRSLVLLWNFAPWSPQTRQSQGEARSPAERFNQHHYSDSWLENLYISASCGGWRHPQKP